MAETWKDALKRLYTEAPEGIDGPRPLARRLRQLSKSQSESNWRRTVIGWATGEHVPTETRAELVAKAFGVPRSALPPSAVRGPRTKELRARLEALEAQAAKAGERTTTALEELTSRVARLEEWRVSVGDGATQAPGG